MLLDYMLHIKHTKHFYLDSRGWNQGRYRGGGGIGHLPHPL